MLLFQIYSAFQNDFLRFAKSLTHDSYMAEDLVQKSYLKALDALELFEHLHPQQVKGWFFTTIKRLFIDDWRQVNLHREKLEQHFVGLSEMQSYEGAWLETLCVRQALGALTPNERELILLRYEMGYSSGEIGERLQIPASTVRNQLASAKKQFNQILMTMQDYLEKDEDDNDQL